MNFLQSPIPVWLVLLIFVGQLFVVAGVWLHNKKQRQRQHEEFVRRADELIKRGYSAPSKRT